jgi:hypothetical protein
MSTAQSQSAAPMDVEETEAAASTETQLVPRLAVRPTLSRDGQRLAHIFAKGDILSDALTWHRTTNLDARTYIGTRKQYDTEACACLQLLPSARL